MSPLTQREEPTPGRTHTHWESVLQNRRLGVGDPTATNNGFII